MVSSECPRGKDGVADQLRRAKKYIHHPGQRGPATSHRTSHFGCRPACLSENEPSPATAEDEKTASGEKRAEDLRSNKPRARSPGGGDWLLNRRSRGRSALTACGLPIRPAQAGMITSRAPWIRTKAGLVHRCLRYSLRASAYTARDFVSRSKPSTLRLLRSIEEGSGFGWVQYLIWLSSEGGEDEASVLCAYVRILQQSTS